MNTADAAAKYLPMTETMFYILLSLREERHGYGVMLHTKDLTDGRLVLGAGTIYQSLGKLERDGLIAATDEIDRKKLYIATDLGQQILKMEAARVAHLYKNVEDLL